MSNQGAKPPVDARLLKIIGISHLFLLVVCTPVNPYFSTLTTNYILPFLHKIYLFRFAPSQAPTYIYQWFLAGLILNAATVVYALVLYFRKEPITRFDQTCTAVFVVLLVAHVLGLPLLYAPIDLTLLPFSVTIVYVIIDVWGIRWSRQSGGGEDLGVFRYPLYCLDLPTFTVLCLILIVAHVLHIDTLFYNGMAAALLVFQTCVYVALMTIVVPESVKSK